MSCRNHIVRRRGESGGTDELAQACFELARVNKRSRRPVDTSEITKLANKYFAIAISFLSSTLQIDSSLISRAVSYLAQAHGVPMEKEDTGWFREKLATVLEVARPYSILDEDGRAFLEEMQVGISKSLLRSDQN